MRSSVVAPEFHAFPHFPCRNSRCSMERQTLVSSSSPFSVARSGGGRDRRTQTGPRPRTPRRQHRPPMESQWSGSHSECPSIEPDPRLVCEHLWPWRGDVDRLQLCAREASGYRRHQTHGGCSDPSPLGEDNPDSSRKTIFRMSASRLAENAFVGIEGRNRELAGNRLRRDESRSESLHRGRVRPIWKRLTACSVRRQVCFERVSTGLCSTTTDVATGPKPYGEKTLDAVGYDGSAYAKAVAWFSTRPDY